MSLPFTCVQKVFGCGLSHPVWGIISVGRISPLQGEGQEFESPMLHQPTGRRNLLKEETDFRHETNTRTEPPGIVRGSIAHGVKVSKC